MQSTATTTLPATPRVHRTVPTPQLRAAFAQVPDPRRRHGTRDPLAALLSLAVAARLANHRSLWAMADWGAAPSDAIKQALGFPSPQPPHLSTLQRRFRRLAAATLAAALTACFDPAAPGEVRPRGSQGIALDGNAQRGRLPHDVRGTHPIPAVRARCHDLGVVLAQLGVDRQRHAAELTVVPALLQHLDWQGRVLPGDALDCQRDLCAQVVAAGGADLVLVDGTHPTLPADIVQLVAPPPPPAPGHPAWTIEEQSARLVEPGPGRLEVREIRVSSELSDDVNWPDAAQVVEITRAWRRKGRTRQERTYGITSLPQTVATAARVLPLKRRVPSGHWGSKTGSITSRMSRSGKISVPATVVRDHR